MQREWMDIGTLPPPGMRPGRVFVVVEGRKWHSDRSWMRMNAGIAATHNDGFDDVDLAHIEARGDMDQGTGKVTHWLPIDFPNFPRHER